MNIRKPFIVVIALGALVATACLSSCGRKSANGAGGSGSAGGGAAGQQGSGSGLPGAGTDAVQSLGQTPGSDQGSVELGPDGLPLNLTPEQRAAIQEAAKVEAARQEAAREEAAKATAAQQEAQRVAVLPVSAPAFVTPSAVSAGPVSVTLSVDQREAVIMYTTDGSNPSATRGSRYGGPFTLSASAIVKAMAFVPGGKSTAVVSSDYTVGELCVSPGASGDGRRTRPLGTLKDALAKAASMGIRTIKLSEGQLSGSYDLVSPMTVSGGWSRDFSSLTGKKTTITAADASGTTTKKAPGYAVRISGSKMDATARLERLVLRGADSGYTAGLVVSDGAAPVIVGCEAYGGFGSYGYGASVLTGAQPSFESCRLDGGEGATSYGLSVDGARATVVSSFLLAGSGSVGGYGLSATDASVKVFSSVLAARAANVGYGAAFYNSKDSRLESCTLVGGSGKEATGVFISESDPAIENCIVAAYGSGKSYGIVANYGKSLPTRLNYTAFLGCAGGLFYNADVKASYASVNASGALVGADGKALASPNAQGCAVAAFELGAYPGFATPAGAALPNAKALAGPSARDVLGKARSEPWTVGAYEL